MPARHLTSLLIAAGLCLGPAVAQDDQEAERLRQLEIELDAARDRETEKVLEQEALLEEIANLQNDLIDTARQIRDQEKTLNDIQLEIDALLAEEAMIGKDLARERGKLATFVGALQSLERQRPPAILVHPDDAARAVRSAILLNTIIPQLKEQAEIIAGELGNLRWVRQSIAQERNRSILIEQAMLRDRDRLEAMLDEKEARQSALDDSLAEERERIVALAEEANSLQSLISGLTTLAARFRPMAKPGTAIAAPVPDGGQLFSRAKGTLQLPVSGAIIERFGAQDELGQQNQGLKIDTGEDAQVVSPFDGTIVFAGPFMEHEQLLLIEAGEGYHILISGMSRIYGQVGDRLLAGEPVGIMGRGDSLRGSRLKSGRNLLYLEFRKDGEPINPLPWLDKENGKVSG